MFRPLPAAVLYLLISTLSLRPAACFGQSDETARQVSDAGETGTDNSDSVLVADLPLLVAQELEDELPEFEKLIEALQHPDPELNEAERMCREFMNARQSHAAQILLAAILYEKKQPESALKLLPSLVRSGNFGHMDSNFTGLWLRSQILLSLGRVEDANRDVAAYRVLEQARREDAEFLARLKNADIGGNRAGGSFEGRLKWWLTSLNMGGDPIEITALVAIQFTLFLIVCLRGGRRQRWEAGGSRKRLFVVSVFVASLWTLPFAIAFVLCKVRTAPGLVWWLLFDVFAFFAVRSSMNPPNLTYVGTDPLPESSDPLLLARIVALSERIGVSTPVVRTQRALDAVRDASAAFVGGLAPHSIVLYDTILAQLKQDEQDAVIGHELGHIANRSIWVYVTVYPLAAVGIVVLSFLGGSYFGTIAGMAVYVGSFRILSRRFEYDCDCRSAIATSPDALARGLRRIYARHPLGRPGLLTSIVHSMASHPSLDERVHALSELAASGAAGADQVVSVPFDEKRVALCRKLVWFFAIAWLSLTAFGITARLLDLAGPAPLFAVHLAAFGPLVLVRAAVRRPTKIGALRVKGRFHWSGLLFRQKLAIFALLGICLFVSANALFPDWYVPDTPRRSPIPSAIMGVIIVVLAGTLVVGGLPRSRTSKQGKLAVTITAAFQRNDFQEALRLCEEDRKSPAKDRLLRYQEAISFLATRQYESCIAICEELFEEFPHFPMPVTALATIYLDRGNPQRALDLTRAIEKDLHKLDPMPALLAARALRKLGQPEEALAESERALKLSPDDTAVLGFMAILAMDRGDRLEADRLIEFGTSILPAEPLLIVARGERAILDTDWETLRSERDALRARLEEDRLLNLHSNLARLADALPDDTSPDDALPAGS